MRVTRVDGSRRRWLLGGAGALVAVIAIVVAVITSGGSSTTPLPAAAPPVGHWAAQPGLAAIRGTTAVVTLDNGMVLAAGGGVGQIPVASAELYNLQTGKWSPTGSLNTARRGATAVVLADGRVLITGGVAGPNILASAELYNPATGTWTPTGSMSTPRLDNTLTLLPDGDVLAAGGTTAQGRAGTGAGQTIIPVASAELYHPATGTWKPTGSMTTARFEATATSLSDGRVLIAGGLGGPGVASAPGPGSVGGVQYPPLTSAEIYDPAVGAFTGAGRMTTGRADQIAARLPGGSVLVAGGVGGTNGLTTLVSAERFNPNTGAWIQLPPMIDGASGAAAATLHSGWVLVAGGETINQGSTSSIAAAEVYDPATNTWRPAGRMSCARAGLGAGLLPDGSVLAVAGDTAFPGQPPVAQGCVDRYFPPANSR
ncbi:MAG: Kelch repeat-containing protein [Acidimicrobiales bacterium]